MGIMTIEIETLKLAIGIMTLILGYFIGEYLTGITKEELKDGQKWFRLIIIISGIASFISLILRNDFLFFGFLFMLIVTSRSLMRRK